MPSDKVAYIQMTKFTEQMGNIIDIPFYYGYVGYAAEIYLVLG